MDESRQNMTIRDYLSLARAQRTAILVPIVVAVIVAIVVSIQQTPEYSATASLAFQDESAALSQIGTPAAAALTPDQRGTQAADTLLSPALIRGVKRDLKTEKSIDELTANLTVAAKPSTDLVEVEAKDSSADSAAALANTVARDAARNQTATARRGYQAAAGRLQAQFDAQKSKDAASKAVFASRSSQLLALATVAEPVQVASMAKVPSSPSSPKPVRNAVVGGFLGLLFGILLAFVRNSLDRVVHTSSDVQLELDYPIVGVVRIEAMGYAGPATVERPPLDKSHVEAFRMLRTNLGLIDGDKAPQCIAVTSSLSQEGKSTVAASLAASMAATGRSVLLVECDLHRPSLARRLGVSSDPGLSAYLTHEAEPADTLRVIGPVAGASNGSGPSSATGFVCIPAGRSAGDASEVLSSKRFRDFLTEVRGAYDVIMLDTAPLLSIADTIEMLSLADAVLFCVRSGETTRDQVRAADSVLRRLSSKPTGVVITGVTSREEGDYGYYAYAYEPMVAG